MGSRGLEGFAPGGFPEDWHRLCIGEAIKEVDSPIEMRDDEEYLLASIRRRFGGMFHRERLLGREILTKNLQRVVPGCFVIARMQIVHGACALADEQFRNYVISKSYSSFESTEHCDTRYFSKLAEQPFMTEYFRDASQGVVIEKMTFQKDRWLNFPVCLPPLEEQRRIAEILDTVDETIRATERVIAKLVVVARAVQDRLVSSARGRPVTLASIAALRGGHGFPEDEQGRQSGSLPFYKVSDMNSIGNEKFLGKANNYVQRETAGHNGWHVLPPGAVVFAKVGAALLSNRRRILRVRAIIDNNMMAAVPRQVVSTEWLYRWLQTVDFARFVQVGALPSVNQGLVGGLRLDLPTLCEQERQTDVLDAHDSRINTEIAQLAKYKRIRAGLATDLLSGRVRTVAA